jgi:hypothetical protein
MPVKNVEGRMVEGGHVTLHPAVRKGLQVAHEGREVVICHFVCCAVVSRLRVVAVLKAQVGDHPIHIGGAVTT